MDGKISLAYSSFLGYRKVRKGRWRYSGFLAGLNETREFAGGLFHRLVDYATVYSDGRVVFTFRNGVEVEICEELRYNIDISVYDNIKYILETRIKAIITIW